MDSNYTLLWHGYNYCTKWLSEVIRIARFCTNFLKIFLGEYPKTPPPPQLSGISKGMFCSILALLKTRLWFVSSCCFFFFAKLSPPLFLLKSKKKKRKKKGPPFLKSWIRHWIVTYTRGVNYKKSIICRCLPFKFDLPWGNDKGRAREMTWPKSELLMFKL